MAKSITRKKVTAQQYQDALDAYKNNEIAARGLAVKRDKDVAKVDDKYNPLFEEYIEQQRTLSVVIQQYCEDAREVLFDRRQVLKYNGVEHGFRKGKVKVEVMDGVTEEHALTQLKELLPEYVRTVEQIAKDKLIADRESTLVAESIAGCGLRFGSEETFFIKVVESRK